MISINRPDQWLATDRVDAPSAVCRYFYVHACCTCLYGLDTGRNLHMLFGEVRENPGQVTESDFLPGMLFLQRHFP
jgi:hypothetical protein